MDPCEIPGCASFDCLRLRFLWVAFVVDPTSRHAARGNPIDVVEWTCIDDATRGTLRWLSYPVLSKHVPLGNGVLESAIVKESLLLSALVILESREWKTLLRSLISLFISFSKYAYLSFSLNFSRSKCFAINSSLVDWKVLTPSAFALKLNKPLFLLYQLTTLRRGNHGDIERVPNYFGKFQNIFFPQNSRKITKKRKIAFYHEKKRFYASKYSHKITVYKSSNLFYIANIYNTIFKSAILKSKKCDQWNDSRLSEFLPTL